MARPMKDGINYFPLDVGFLQDKKTRLIKGEFGAKGVVVLLNLLCSVYGENGYFKKWDEEDCLLMSEGVACGCGPELIGEVVTGCVKRSIFDERVFNMFGVLTSPGIQRRYLRAVSTYENIDIIQEYWLLDINNKKDVPASISKKITFKKVSLQNNPVFLQNNPINLQKNATNKIKEKERKGKERKENKSATGMDCSSLFITFEKCGFQITGYTAEELPALAEEYSVEWVEAAIKEAAESGKKTIRYVKGILYNWKTAGAMTRSGFAKSAEAQKETSGYYDCGEDESL